MAPPVGNVGLLLLGLLVLLLFELFSFDSFAGRLVAAASASSISEGVGAGELVRGLRSPVAALLRSLSVFLTAFPASESAAKSRSKATLVLGTA